MTEPERLPAAVETFLRNYIDTLQQIELLMLLMKSPDRWWDAPAVAKAIGTDPTSARVDLERLGSRNLLAISISSEVRYRFQPGTASLQAATDAFQDALRTHGLDVFRFVSDTPRRAMRDFADAFRIRRDDAG
jgi:hypothetical protein